MPLRALSVRGPTGSSRLENFSTSLSVSTKLPSLGTGRVPKAKLRVDTSEAFAYLEGKLGCAKELTGGQSLAPLVGRIEPIESQRMELGTDEAPKGGEAESSSAVSGASGATVPAVNLLNSQP